MSEQARHVQGTGPPYVSKRLVAMVRSGMGSDYPDYVEGFTPRMCSSARPNLDGLDMCAEVVGQPQSEEVQRFCAHMSVKGLFVSLICDAPRGEIQRYARFGTYFSLELAAAQPTERNAQPSAHLLTALAISQEFLAGEERCIPLRQFVRVLIQRGQAFAQQGDAIAARSAAAFAAKYVDACVSEKDISALHALQGDVK